MNSLQFELPKLPSPYVAEFVSYENRKNIMNSLFDQVFNFDTPFKIERDEARLQKWKEATVRWASNTPLFLSIVIKDTSTNSYVGWVTGEQKDWETFYLRNSGFIPSARRKGIYTTIHSALEKALKEHGIERLESQHLPNNDKILILKLKTGYSVYAVALDERFGPLVTMVKYLYPDRSSQFVTRYGCRD